MIAGTRPVARSFLTALRLAADRGKALNDSDFMIQPATSAASPPQQVHPPLNANSEVTEELLWIRLIASPNRPATDSVVTFTPSIDGRKTVSVVISSSIFDFIGGWMPKSLKMAGKPQA